MVTEFQKKFIDRTVKNNDGEVIGYHIRKVPECEPFSGQYLTLEKFSKAERQMAIFSAGEKALQEEENKNKKQVIEPMDNEDNSIPESDNQFTKKLGRKGKK